METGGLFREQLDLGPFCKSLAPVANSSRSRRGCSESVSVFSEHLFLFCCHKAAQSSSHLSTSCKAALSSCVLRVESSQGDTEAPTGPDQTPQPSMSGIERHWWNEVNKPILPSPHILPAQPFVNRPFDGTSQVVLLFLIDAHGADAATDTDNHCSLAVPAGWRDRHPVTS